MIDTQEQKSIAGKTARHYTYAITVTLVPKDAGVPANIRLLLPTFLVTGDQWTADMPDGVAAAKLRTATFMQRFPPASAKGLAPVLEKMATIKGVALEGTQSFRITVSDLAPQEMRASIPKEPVVTQTRTTTLSEAALPDALFAVPKDYKKVTAPAS